MEAPAAVPAGKERSVAQAWLRALELTAPIARNRNRILLNVIEEAAALHGDKPALLSHRERFTYQELVGRAHQYAHWALTQGIKKGDVVALLMTNRPEYFAIWLGISSVGAVVALLNTNLAGSSLAHCIHTVAARHLIVSSEFRDSFASSLEPLNGAPIVWIHGASDASFRRIDQEVAKADTSKLDQDERPALTIEDRALYIFTSGTTGLPKAANVTHARTLQWTHWFAGMMDIQPQDRMYDCLPMYHSIGGVLAPGAALVAGGSVVLHEKFSASQFWTDVTRWQCTIFQYIGEFCRYLVQAPSSPQESTHSIRLACGNGLAPEVWPAFKERFRIPQILEFYAATEGNVSLFNVEGKPGAIGRIPPYLAHRFSPVLIQLDADTNEPVRNGQGFCIRCAPNAVGEAIGKALSDPSAVGSRFDGYTDWQATEQKYLRNVFQPGDLWIRTGDLMRKDERGFYYFVDRVGDTFRWKGENVATSETAAVLSSFPGVQHAIVYGVRVPGCEGRAGMAALVADSAFDLAGLRRFLSESLPAYARPVFLRIAESIEVTGTFKYSKADLIRQGFDPSRTDDIIYLNHPKEQAMQRIDALLWQQLQRGEIRL